MTKNNCLTNIYKNWTRLENGCSYDITPSNETCISIQKLHYTLITVKAEAHYYEASENYGTKYRSFSNSRIFYRQKNQEYNVICPSSAKSTIKHLKIRKLTKGHEPLLLNISEDSYPHQPFDSKDIAFFNQKLQDVISIEKNEKSVMLDSMEKYKKATKAFNLLSDEFKAAKNITDKKISELSVIVSDIEQSFGYLPMLVYALVIFVILSVSVYLYRFFGCTMCKSKRTRVRRSSSEKHSLKLKPSAPSDSYIDLREMR